VESVQESLKNQFFRALSRYCCKLIAKRLLRVPPRLPYKRLLIGTKLYLHSRMSASSKTPEGLKDSECKKGHLGNRPPVPCVPPTDLLQTKDSSKTLKVKLADGTVFSMSIFAKGSLEDCLQHVIAVLHLINQKGLHVQCKKHAKEMKNAAATLGALQRKSVGLTVRVSTRRTKKPSRLRRRPSRPRKLTPKSYSRLPPSSTMRP
jgi:hypothetical protein